MTGAQIRAARTLLKWTQTELAERARIHRRTIANLETENMLAIRILSLPCGEHSKPLGLHFTTRKFLGSVRLSILRHIRRIEPPQTIQPSSLALSLATRDARARKSI